MVYDIAKAIGVKAIVDVLATDSCGDSFDIEGVHYLGRSRSMMLKNIFQCLSIRELFGFLYRYRMSKGNAIRMVYYWLFTGYLKSVLKKGHYDVIHIHGLKFPTFFWRKVCNNSNVPVLFTSHGLNSFSDTVMMEPEEKRYEKDFLKSVIEGENTLTVISSGMKRLIEQFYNSENCENIVVVCNSFSFKNAKNDEKPLNIRKEYHIPNNAKIIVCIGNVCVRKNQGQLIKAFDCMPESVTEQTYILFVGSNPKSDYNIDTLSKDSKWKDHFIACGAVPKERVHYYYEQSDGVALISLSEGFGLSLIEGMHFGKPCMTFTDVDAFVDIYHPVAMVGVKEHSDEAVAKGIEMLLTSDWNSKDIRDYSCKFESQSMAANYIRVYIKITER